MMTKLLTLTWVLLPAMASAEEMVGVIDQGDEVVVVVGGVTPASEVINVEQDRIELLLDRSPTSPMTFIFGDPTVKRVELLAGDRPRVSIKTRLGPRGTELLSRGSSIEQGAQGIRIRIPRDGRRPRPIPEPALVAPPEEKKVTPLLMAAPPAPPPPTAPVAPAAAPMPSKPPPSPAPQRQLSLEPEPSRAGGLLTWLVAALGLAASTALILLAKKRRAAVDAATGMTVTATFSIGPKTKLCLVSVRQRELLLAVGDAGAQLILDLTGDIGERGELETSEPTSPAITGLLELKRRAGLSGQGSAFEKYFRGSAHGEAGS